MRADGRNSLPPLNPGLMRHRVTFQQKSYTGQNTHGERQYTYADVMTCYASKRALSGRELETAQQRWSDARIKWEVPYDARLNSTALALNYNGTRLDVLDIADPIGDEMRLVVITKEVK